jgi:hypothetical protein
LSLSRKTTHNDATRGEIVTYTIPAVTDGSEAGVEIAAMAIDSTVPSCALVTTAEYWHPWNR